MLPVAALNQRTVLLVIRVDFDWHCITDNMWSFKLPIKFPDGTTVRILQKNILKKIKINLDIRKYVVYSYNQTIKIYNYD